MKKMFRVDEPTVNGRIYPREVVEKAIEEYMSSEAHFGELDHPENLNINLDRVSHKVIDTFITDKGDWMARIEILKTPMGEVLEQLIANGILPKLDPRSTGIISEDFVVSDLQIVAIDVISEAQEKEIAKKAKEKEETETTCSSTQKSPSEKDGSQE